MNTEIKCIFEADQIDSILNKNTYPENKYVMFTVKALDGEVASYAAMITLTATTINAFAKIVIEAIKNKLSPKVKIKGKSISIEIEGITEDKIIKIIEDMNKE